MESKANKPYPLRWYDPILLRILPPLAALLIKLLMLTCRLIKKKGLEAEKEALKRSGGKAVYALWHQRMSYNFHYGAARRATVVISQSRDGEYAARLASWLGFKNVRGSSTRGGYRALKEVMEKIKEGERAVIFADGPLGPARVAKMGAILIARETGAPLICGHWSADRCWILNTWDRYLVPKPFARVVVYFTEPIWVPRFAKGKELETYRRLLEDTLNRSARWCDEQFGPERPWRRVKKKDTPEVGPLDITSSVT